jgi:hypothetical protein
MDAPLRHELVERITIPRSSRTQMHTARQLKEPIDLSPRVGVGTTHELGAHEGDA